MFVHAKRLQIPQCKTELGLKCLQSKTRLLFYLICIFMSVYVSSCVMHAISCNGVLLEVFYAIMIVRMWPIWEKSRSSQATN